MESPGFARIAAKATDSETNNLQAHTHHDAMAVIAHSIPA
jgi:hypothetical protein